MTTPLDIKDIIDANGGRLIGRTRLQKSAYFLEAAGVGFGFDFNYHYYGPYSEDLAVAASDAEALKLIRLAWETSQNGVPYAVYESRSDQSVRLGNARREEILRILGNYDAISLELAATAHFLAQNGYENDPWSETRRRKLVKATDDRIAKAKRLLGELMI